ncbi:MAG: hypothetical protein HYT63_01405 [Candidatus Yanofskybacteria bacterium]|nr:hypothetical protein [Candidatus Yanofskybacteria bacterium]
MPSIKEKLLNKSENSEPKGLSWILVILLLILLSVAITYFGGSSPDSASSSTGSNISSRPSRTYSIFYSGGVFSPTNLRIHQGDSVQFQNKSLFPIKITSQSSVKNKESLGFQTTKEILPDQGFDYTFQTAGVFDYYNERNPNEAGTIIIKQ